MEWYCIFLVLTLFVVLLLGFPVAFSLAGTSLFFALIGTWTGDFDNAFIVNIAGRIQGIMTNVDLIAVPLFVFMGVMLEKSKIAEQLLDTMASLFKGISGGLAISVVVVGMLLGASTGIVGATVVTMGLISLPSLMRHGYHQSVATGTICASGTLGQIIPPSIVLILLGSVISNEFTSADAMVKSQFERDAVSVDDMFMGALIPGMVLVVLYCIYLFVLSKVKPNLVPNARNLPDATWGQVIKVLIPPFVLIVVVLGSILVGFANPSESAAVGAVGAMVLAMLNRSFSWQQLKEVSQTTTQVSAMVFAILIGATFFSATFRGFEGDELVMRFLLTISGQSSDGLSEPDAHGAIMVLFVVMLVMFLLGFFLDFFEITFVVVPLVVVPLMMLGFDPVWLGVMFAVNLQTSFLTPPFGFSLFYLRGVAPPEIKTTQIYKGVIPFIMIQLLMLCLLIIWPQMATYLPALSDTIRQ